MTEFERTQQDEPGQAAGPLTGHTAAEKTAAEKTSVEKNTVTGTGTGTGSGSGSGTDEPAPLVASPEGHERSARHFDHGTGDGDLHTELVPTGTRDELAGRLRHAVTGFVDEPRASVEEADHILEDLTASLTETLASRRDTLRTSWQDSKDDTEQLRIALRDYRETAERLLRL
ncbi:hypothetical protein AB0J38_02920 [Streptomyces sp. NPDC050095]|uniref:hypothetical protein n=1 Tax=unclassified Streptomyces TaxID=2593676 RepID=UPI003428E034